MKQVFYHYLEWEDYKAGMYKLPILIDEKELIIKCSKLLKDSEWFFEEGQNMVKLWSKSAQQNLTDKNINRQAWIGQATCCFVFGATEDTTKKAWRTLKEDEQVKANKVADKIFFDWKRKYLKEGKLSL